MTDELKTTGLVVKLIAYALFAALGGGLRYVLKQAEGDQKIVATQAIIEAASAGFMGALVALACAALGLNAMWTGVAAGVTGWLGAAATVRLLEVLLYKRLGVTTQDVAAAAMNRPSAEEQKP